MTFTTAAANVCNRQHVLVLKLGAIGDCIMVLPAAYALHCAGYEVHWACAPGIAAVLRLYPWLHVHAVDEAGLLRGGPMQRARALLGIWQAVGGRRYSLCATLYYDGRYALMSLPVRAARKLMLSRTDREFMLQPGRHHTDEYVRILTGRPDSEARERAAPVPVAVEPLPASLVPSTGGRPRVVLVPGGARNLMRDNPLRRWPVAAYVELAAQLLGRGYQVVLAGGPDDLWVLPMFATLETVDCIGKLSLVETLGLLESADVTVSHDTGPLHLAGITRTAIVAIFGPTDPHNFCPQRSGVVALWGGESFACRPCYDGREFAPCRNNGCVQQVSPEMVLHHVDDMLQAARDGRERPLRILTDMNERHPVSR